MKDKTKGLIAEIIFTLLLFITCGVAAKLWMDGNWLWIFYLPFGLVFLTGMFMAGYYQRGCDMMDTYRED